MKLTKQDYQNALEIWLSYRNGDSVLLFIGYLEEIIEQELNENSVSSILEHTADDGKNYAPNSIWRTDIENAPRRTILILDSSNDPFLVYPDYDGHDTWKTVTFYDDIFKNREIAYWMEIPKQPEL